MKKDYVEAKMKNSLELDYPKDKLKIIWVTDGTMEHLIYYKIIQIQRCTTQERNGKIGAMNRGMEFVKHRL
jgi:cellulose synthase/poly-beta-1,6-N-acetylglucosamine synthase-like glycosyltransferase